jgi:hypothetical protein
MAGQIYIFLAPVFLFIFNSLTQQLCEKKNMSGKQQDTVYRTINVSITILLISSYISNMF